MSWKINEVAFTPEEVKAGKLYRLLDFLFSMNDFEIYITSDGYCQIVNFVACADKSMTDAGFKFVDENYVVVHESCVDWNKVEQQEQEN